MKKKRLLELKESPSNGNKLLKLTTLAMSMMLFTTAYAAEEPEEKDVTKVKKVVVTGSSIKGVAAQSTSPITIIKGEDLAEMGVTSVEEALNRVSANQAGFSTAENVGSSSTTGSAANLRGLGIDKTLILLNGRRVASSAFSTYATNLNIIPMAMIDRIEVLRDGASAIYGADAIAGVINFITKDQYKGLSFTGSINETEHKGGESYSAAVYGGFGDYEDDGFNLNGLIDYRQNKEIMAKDRAISRRGSVIPELGVDGSSFGAFPANLYDPWTYAYGNPYPNDCNNEPGSAAWWGFCYLNTSKFIGIQPQVDTLSSIVQGSLKINDHFKAYGEYIFTRSEVAVSIAPDVFQGTLMMPSSSPYFPGNGITPYYPGLSGNDVYLYVRSQAGNRESMSTNDSHRLLLGVEGSAYGWDIDAGLSYSISDAQDEFTGGYLNRSELQKAINAGKINPFGKQLPEHAGLWQTFEVNGKTNEAELKQTIVDVTVSRPLFELPAGEVGFALGASFTSQDWDSGTNSELVAQVPSSGIDPNKEESAGKRDISSIFTELQVPILPSLEAQFAARYDDYSDFGDTFNPKVGIRWEPIKQLMFRSAYSTGFRAPTLYDINAPVRETYTYGKYSDPILCPGGTAIEPRYQNECNTQFKSRLGGSKDLDPEESTSLTAGFVFEPIKDLVFTADYYKIDVDGLVSSIGEASLFWDPVRYADRFVRNAEGRIEYLNTTLINAGGLRTEGVDISLNYLSPKTSTGRFGFGIEGTYVMSIDYQNEDGAEWNNYVGEYANPAVVRWKHWANLNWSYEDWKMMFEQQFVRGYDDHNKTGQAQYNNHKVSDYALYNVSTTYTGLKNIKLTAGIKNIFDEDPSASNVTDNFQYGYDPRYADPTGRTYYMRATYKFK